MKAFGAQVTHRSIAQEMIARAALKRAGRLVAAQNRIPPRVGAGRPTQPQSVAAYLAVTGRNIPAKIAARVADIDTKSMRRALAAIEDRRDDGEFDEWLSRLEAA